MKDRLHLPASPAFVIAAVILALVNSGCGPAPGRATSFTQLGAQIAASCSLSSSCHNSAGKMGGLDLQRDPYGALVNKATQPSPNFPHLANLVRDYPMLVTPFEPSRSAVWVKLNMNPLMDSGSGATAYGFGMPQGNPLGPATLEMWNSWITDGALDN